MSAQQRRNTAWTRFRRNRPAFVSLFVVSLIALLAIFAPVIADDPKKPSGLLRQPPSAAHWFGTDQIGRDQFSRVLYGARTSLIVGVAAVISVTLIGVTLGLIAGWFGGFIDQLVMRSVDVILAFPYVLLAIAIVTVIGGGIRSLLIVTTVIGFGVIARFVRAEMLRVKGLEYTEAAIASGASSWRIIMRHALPNAIPPIAMLAAGSVADFIIVEAALSFLGRGIQEPTPSWGLMIARSRSFFEEAPHLLLGPGLSLVVLSLALVFIGDGVRDALDPRAEQRFL
jgi:peptide/nickel transport system permease protein